MTSKEGTVTCQYPGQNDDSLVVIDQELYNSMSIIIEDILKKVHELTSVFVEKHDFDNEKSDPFEVIPYPVESSKYFTVESKASEYLDTIEENDLTETSASLEMDPDELPLNDEEVYSSVDDMQYHRVRVLKEKSASQKTLVGDRNR